MTKGTTGCYITGGQCLKQETTDPSSLCNYEGYSWLLCYWEINKSQYLIRAVYAIMWNTTGCCVTEGQLHKQEPTPDLSSLCYMNATGCCVTGRWCRKEEPTPVPSCLCKSHNLQDVKSKMLMFFCFFLSMVNYEFVQYTDQMAVSTFYLTLWSSDK